MLRNSSVKAVQTERRLRELFEATFIDLAAAVKLLGLSVQYGRQLILDNGEPEQDYFLISGKYLISVDYLHLLANSRSIELTHTKTAQPSFDYTFSDLGETTDGPQEKRIRPADRNTDRRTVAGS